MLFTWSTKNLCIIFRSWHISGTISLLASLAAVAALTAGYEYVREMSRKYEEKVSEQKSVNIPSRFSPAISVWVSSAEQSPKLPSTRLSRDLCFIQDEMVLSHVARRWSRLLSMLSKSSIHSSSCEYRVSASLFVC
jgi:hypothetical protein